MKTTELWRGLPVFSETLRSLPYSTITWANHTLRVHVHSFYVNLEATYKNIYLKYYTFSFESWTMFSESRKMFEVSVMHAKLQVHAINKLGSKMTERKILKKWRKDLLYLRRRDTVCHVGLLKTIIEGRAEGNNARPIVCQEYRIYCKLYCMCNDVITTKS